MAPSTLPSLSAISIWRRSAPLDVFEREIPFAKKGLQPCRSQIAQLGAFLVADHQSRTWKK
jgi:hypothetical protein